MHVIFCTIIIPDVHVHPYTITNFKMSSETTSIMVYADISTIVVTDLISARTLFYGHVY